MFGHIYEKNLHPKMYLWRGNNIHIMIILHLFSPPAPPPPVGYHERRNKGPLYQEPRVNIFFSHLKELAFWKHLLSKKAGRRDQNETWNQGFCLKWPVNFFLDRPFISHSKQDWLHKTPSCVSDVLTATCSFLGLVHGAMELSFEQLHVSCPISWVDQRAAWQGCTKQ